MICFGCWPLVAKRSCIKGRFHAVYALFHIIVHSVHARCLIKFLLGIFSLVWTPMSTKIWGFSCFLIRNMFGSLVVYLTHLAPHVHFPCFGHALHKANSCTHLCYPCHTLVYTLFLAHSQLLHTLTLPWGFNVFCASVSDYRYIRSKFIIVFRFRCDWVLPLFPNSCLNLESFLGCFATE